MNRYFVALAVCSSLALGQPFISTAIVQPAQLSPTSLCEGSALTLTAPPGRTFASREQVAVVFTPCVVAKDIDVWTGDRIVVKVPRGVARDARVYLAAVGVPPRGVTPHWHATNLLRGATELPFEPLPEGFKPDLARFENLKARLRSQPLVRPSKADLDFLRMMELDRMSKDIVRAPPVCRPLVLPVGQTVHVDRLPELESFEPFSAYAHPADAQYDVERGPVDLSWRVSEVTNATLTIGASNFSVSGQGSQSVDVLGPASTGVTLKAANSCGSVSRTLTLRPVVVARLWGSLDMNENRSREIHLGIARPLTQALTATRAASPALLTGMTVAPRDLRINPGALEAVSTVSFTNNQDWLNNTSRVFTLSYTCPPTIGGVTVVCDPPSLSGTIFGSPAPALPAGHARLKGALTFTDFGAGSAVRPIRGIRVELTGARGSAVARTDAAGRFDVFIPEGAPYKARVVGEAALGQVNFRDNIVTWYWSDEQTFTSCGPSTFCLDFNETRRDPGFTYRAVDDLFVAAQRLATVGIAPADLGKVVVMPITSDSAYTTDMVGGAVIWINQDRVWDGTVAHELGHVIAVSAGKYRAWAAWHDGCAPTLWPRREFAFFEGWAEFTRFFVFNTRSVNFCSAQSTPRACAAQGNPGLCTAAVAGDEVENYVANSLIETNLTADPTGQALFSTYRSPTFRATPAPTGTLRGFREVLTQQNAAVGAALTAVMSDGGT